MTMHKCRTSEFTDDIMDLGFKCGFDLEQTDNIFALIEQMMFANDSKKENGNYDS